MEREYRCYRCARYNSAGHPRVRLVESELDRQMLDLFQTMRIEDESIRRWVVEVLRAKSKTAEQDATTERNELQRELDAVRKQKDRLLNLRHPR